jgi:hypothetical protein
MVPKLRSLKERPMTSVIRTVRIATQQAILASKEYFEKAGIKLSGQGASYLVDVDIQASAEMKVNVAEVEGLILLTEEHEITITQFCAFLADNKGEGARFVACLRGTKYLTVFAAWDEQNDVWEFCASRINGRPEYLHHYHLVTPS